jgi:tRNA G18 (ribose-2'-O)-methylase SpoU
MGERVVILENIRSTFNVGSVFRTADGAGISKIFLVGITPTPDHNKIKKTALGAENYVPWEHIDSTSELIKKLKEEGYNIYAVEQSEKSVDFREIKLKEKSAFIFGNEISGVDPQTLSKVDYVLEIPMKGKKNSLNVSTTVGIILYQFI